MRKLPLLLACCGIALSLQAKKQLGHEDFDSWCSPRIHALSNDGNWAAFSVVPQEGDARLYVRNVRNGKEIVIPRGAQPTFLAGSDWLVAKIVPLFADTRKAKIDKKKDFDMPQDSLAIVNLRTMQVEKIPCVVSYRVPKDGGTWLAYESCDTAYISPKALKDKKAGHPLVVRDLATPGRFKVIPWVKEYRFAKPGNRLAFYTAPWKKDTLAASARMMLMNLPDTATLTLLADMKHYGQPVFDETGSRLAFTATLDSAESGTRRYDTYLADLTSGTPVAEQQYILRTVNEGHTPHIMPPRIYDESKRDSIMADMRSRLAAMAGDSLFVNQYSVPAFSHDGKRLIVGVARYIAPDDTTIVDFEQPALDIWRWDAPYTPPQELSNRKKLEKHTLPVVINLASGREQLVTPSELASVSEADRWDAPWALVRDPETAVVSQQWDYAAPEDLYAVNIETGERRLAGRAPIESSEISPEGKYIFWYDNRHWYAYDIAADTARCLDAEVPYPLWDEEQDIPLQRQPYGIMGWTAGDKAMLVYDRHDIWSLDPTGASKPVNLTKGEGRKSGTRYRYRKTDPDKRFFTPGDKVILDVFDYATKKNGLATFAVGAPAVPAVKVLDEYKFYQLRRAKNADNYAFIKTNFHTSPDVWLATGGNFASARKVSDANPQMKDYSWGKASLVDWYAYDGRPSQGVLYTPDDLDPSKKYPMLVVFYERNSEELYAHYTMEPSWSWVNYPFYVSRGYVVFVPDVHYYTGIPGESAYNYICSGVDELCERYPWIDRDHIGIDGQSWGGYQTAYLVTRTDMFACAGSGAPVSNMTSAFGGIRWGTGDSRQAQYEVGQSRIGRNLWEAPELYIANSPLFNADRVNTPLLIMHNDEDGAVPWYQGIEYFMALRRLGKPVWMLQYNGEAHNIRARKNRKDITHRLQEFFDHYLKGAPMPRWMKEGIPVLRKGQELRYGE